MAGEAKSLWRPPRPPGSALGFFSVGGAGLVAAAGSHHHVAVLFEDDVGAVVEVEHRDGVELRGGAAGLGDRVRVDEVDLEGGGLTGQTAVEPIAPGFSGAGTHQGLHDGVVGGVHVGVQREGALALAVVRRVALRSDDPVLRAEKRALKQEEVGTRWGGVATTAVGWRHLFRQDSFGGFGGGLGAKHLKGTVPQYITLNVNTV